MMDARISIIVPVYNTENYLPRCVASLQAQTLQALRIILVDDGSTDTCPQLCDGYAQNDARITVLHLKNGGQSAARNAGIAQAETEFVAFVDSDDSIQPQMYETLLSLAQTNNAQAALCGIARVVAHRAPRIADDIKDSVFSGQAAVKQGILLPLLAGQTHFDDAGFLNASACRGIYARAIIQQNALAFANTAFSEDLLFNLDFFAHCTTVASTAEPFYLYYDNPASTTTTFTNTRFDMVCTLYAELTVRYPRYHLSAEEALPRISTLILGFISVCMKQEVAASLRQHRSCKTEIAFLCDAKETRAALQECPYAKLLFPLNLFCSLIQHRQITLFTLLTRLYLRFFDNK
ncbi:MAG: glycosyltransferase [Ruthenibacterium sp.]